MKAEMLIPIKKMTPRAGSFALGTKVVLASPSAGDLLPLGQLADDLKRLTGARVAVERNAFGPAAVRVSRDSSMAREEYRLTIAPEGVRINAATEAGAYYAIGTLRDLLAIHGRRLPACEIHDWPDFARRGVYHDCSRGKVPTLATLKAFVERLARWKINELQLYVENVFTFRRHPDIGQDYSPFTPAELLELQDHCRRHHVNFVGSLASFGHLEKVLALPQYQHLAERPGVAGVWGLMSLCATDPKAVAFVAELYEEFVPIFEATDFNVCCDETVDLGLGRSKRRCDKVGKGRVYLEFLLKLRALCERHGKRMNAWADIVLEYPEMLGDLPKDIVMLNWDYDIGGTRVKRSHEIADAGLPMVVCPGTNGWQSHGTRLTEAMVNVAQFAAEGLKQKAEGLLNTDWGDFGHRNFLGVSLHSFAHGAAHSWHHRGVSDAAFTDTFCRRVLGQRDGKLAAALRLLGDSYLLCSQTPARNADLYWALVEPLAAAKKAPPKGMHNLREAGLRRIVEQLGDASIWPAPPAHADAFDRLAFEEFRVASEMEVLACRRGLAAVALRAGKAVAPRELRSLADATGLMADHFKRLWLARNKPSRLKDNLAAFAAVGREASKLAK